MGTIEFETYWQASFYARNYRLVSMFTDGTLYEASASVSRQEGMDMKATDEKGGWFMTIWPSNVAYACFADEKQAKRAEEWGELFYAYLRSISHFRFATAGIEVEGIRSFEELSAEMKEITENRNFWPGLVISEAIWKDSGSPSLFVPFKSGYYWRPYEGEVAAFKEYQEKRKQRETIQQG